MAADDRRPPAPGGAAPKRTAGLSPEKLDALIRKLQPAKAAGEAATAIPRRAAAGPPPLSFTQERLWFLHHLAPESPQFNVPVALGLSGPLDAAALAAGLAGVVARHEALRTVFPITDGRPTQQILPALAVAMPAVDLSALAPAVRRTEARRLVDRGARLPFDPARGPLVRALLFRLAPAEHQALLTLHHLAADGWSMGVLLAELSAFYRARLAGTELSLRELPIQFGDFAAWQRDRLAGETLDKLLAFWRPALAGAGAPLELPGDRPRPSVQTFDGAVAVRTIAPALRDAVEALGREKRATTFMTVLAAFAAELSRLSGQTDLSLGSPVANRSRPEIEGLIGCLVNLVVLRLDLSGDPTFATLLERARETSLEALARQEMPLEKLVAELAPERTASRSPLFQVAFSLGAERAAMAELAPGLALEGLAVDNGTSKVDLALFVEDGPAGLVVKAEHSSVLFDRTTIERWLAGLETLLAAAVRDSGLRLSALPLLSPAERQELGGEWNDSAGEVPQPPFFHCLFAAQAARTPDAVAVVDDEETFTYGGLDGFANGLAHELARRGVGPERFVGLATERTARAMLGLLAIWKAGGAYVPLDPSYPAERLAAMLEEVGSPLVLSRGTPHPGPLPASGARGPEGPWRAEGAGLLDELPPWTHEPPADGLDPDHLAYAIFTSGSTGRPKGVLLAHGGLANLVGAAGRFFPVRQGERMLLFSPLNFDSSIFEIVFALGHGAALHLVPREDLLPGPGLLARIEGFAIEHLTLTPSALAALAHRPLPHLSDILVAGEACTAELVAEWQPGRRFFNAYGPTEVTVSPAIARCRAGDGKPAIGRALLNKRLYVLDPQGRPAPVGVPGELFLGGAGVARGYLARPGLTAERFLPDPFAVQPGARMYRTGDRVRFATDGQLDFLGRTDHQVKIRGFRIETGEIEAQLLLHPGVREAVVVAREDSPGHKRLVAYTVPTEGEAPSAAELRELLRRRLPDYMVPAAFVSLAALPLNPHDKVDREALPAPEATRPELEAAFTAPRTPAEAKLAAIWQRVLRLERVGVDDNFFELGGDSILTIQVVTQAAEQGLKLEPAQLFEHQTVAELAAVAKGGAAAARAGVSPGSEPAEDSPAAGDEVPLTPIQRWFLDADPPDPHHFNQAVLLAAPGGLRAGTLARALVRVVAHHEALGLRFERVDGRWRQTFGNAEPSFLTLDLSALALAAQGHAVEQASAKLQTTLDLARGPLTRTALFRLGHGRGDRLLWIAHHLVVDGVSWRLLLADLATAYAALERGEEPRLAAPAASFAAWARRLAEHAASGTVAAQGEVFRRMAAVPLARLPRRSGENGNDTASVTVALDAARTEALLRSAHRAHGNRPEELLLAALAEALAAATGSRRLRFDREGHGRLGLFPGLDVGRTVGWFTVLHPVALDLEGAATPAAVLQAVKEQARAVPDGGLAFGLLRHLRPEVAPESAALDVTALGPAEVLFNYHGRLDRALDAESALMPAPESPGPASSPRQKRPYRLEVTAAVTGGGLETAWVYSPGELDPAAVESWAARFRASLEALVDHCLAPGARARTPADFPLLALQQSALDRLLAAAGSEVEDVYPLTPVQQGMLFHCLQAPGSGVYVEQLSLDLGGLDLDAFAEALAALVARHPVLRTSFHWEGLDEPLQVVHPRAGLPFERLDWRQVPPAERRARLAELAARERRAGFELGTPPLMRWTAVDLGEGRHRLVWTFHHMVLDGWSQSILLGELFALYEPLLAGAPPPPLPRAQPFRDYVAWLAGQDLAAAEGYWKSALAGVTAPTPLGTDRPAPLADDAGGDRLSIALDVPVADGLRAAAARHRLTLNALFQAAWGLVLARGSGEYQVMFGVVTSGRAIDLAGVQGMVGVFLNTLPLRVTVEPAADVGAWLAGVATRSAGMHRYEHSPLPRVQAMSEVPRGQPLFDSILAYESYGADEAAGSRAAASFELGAGEVQAQTHYPLTLGVVPARAGAPVHVSAEYQLARFDRSTVARLLRHLAAALSGLSAGTARTVAEVPWLGGAERHQLLAEWGGEPHPPDLGGEPEDDLYQAFARQAAVAPDAVAVASQHAAWSYAGLEAWAGRIAARLRAEGAGPESVVAVSAERGPAVVAAMLGVLRAGGAFLPVDPAYPAERLAFLLADSRASLLLTDRPERATAGGARALDLGATEASDTAGPGTAELAAVPRGATSLAYVIYTSGSTGRPKGVMVEDRATVAYSREMVRRFGLVPGDRVLQFASIGFDVVIEEVFPALLAGATVAVHEGDPALLVADLDRLLAELAVTVVELPAAFWEEWVDGLARAGRRPPAALRLLLLGCEKPSPRRLTAWRGFGVPLVYVFGLTETSVTSTLHRLPPALDLGRERDLDLPIGRPVAGHRVLVLGPHLRPLPAGLIGELAIGGVGVARGYLRRPGLTAGRFLPDPFGPPGSRLYATGDRARLRADGNVEFLGRLDHQVKVRGFRVELGEVEAALRSLPEVAEAAVLLRDDLPGRQGLVAYVVAQAPLTLALSPPAGRGDQRELAKPLPAPSPLGVAAAGSLPAPSPRGSGERAGVRGAELRDALRERLPEYMVPSLFVLLDELPVTAHGKVDRRALHRLAAARDAAREEASPAATPAGASEIERRVAAVWREVLGTAEVGREDNFFDLGGHSLLLFQVKARLGESLGREVSILDLFQLPTVAALAAHLAGAEADAAPAAEAPPQVRPVPAGREIAIVGMAGRFPGAASVDELWANVAAGVESIRTFGDEELRAAGTHPSILERPNYVKSRGALAGVDLFDAAFFGYTPREAELMDPQHRLFLETAWEALERAGYDPARYGGRVGVYGGMSLGTYLLALVSRPELLAPLGGMQVVIGNDKDYLPTRVSYKLNLRGPSVNVQTACSTSLVAVHVACQALLAGECEMALAGGVSASVAEVGGYLYEEGGIASPDGHCRAFDAAARGTVGGSGVGIVVLKRLADALADGDTVHAVIRGSAINNDGAAKVGYTAPSVAGQAAVLAAALAAAGVGPETVDYVEGHGTGTPLGDPIELAALNQAYGDAHLRRGRRCALGSVKSNLGHLDDAAGIAGLIKTVLALAHRQLPPSLHFERPNPAIDFGGFAVQAALAPWPAPSSPDGGERPRRAGVSSFGIGGTNAHLVLEEAPAGEPSGPARPWQLLPLSARSAAALEEATERLHRHLAEHPDQPLADVAFTLQAGRRAFVHRRFLVARDREDALAVLAARDPKRLAGRQRTGGARPVAFLLPGQGTQHVGMGRGLYEEEPTFRHWLDRAAEMLEPRLGLDLRRVLYPPAEDEEDARALLAETRVTQPALFAVEHALAQVWIEWGVRPRALLGHSLGEYVAACLAGVFSLADALALVAERGRLMQARPAGAMAAVSLPEASVRARLGGGLALAAVNAPAACTVSGPTGEVERLLSELAAEGVEHRRLHTSHAFHSPTMEPLATPLRELIEGFALRRPSLPVVSNLTGALLADHEATDPGYWVRHMLAPVRFADGAALLAAEPETVFLEVGPGRTLSELLSQQARGSEGPAIVTSMRAAREPGEDGRRLAEAAGRLWLAGADLDWEGYHRHERRRRVPLPTYPFERKRYWIDALTAPRAEAPLAVALGAAEPAAAALAADAPAEHARPGMTRRAPRPGTVARS